MNSFDSTISNAKLVPAIAFAAAAVLALSIGHDLLHMPLQVSDSLTEILDAAAAPSAWHQFQAHLADVNYFRPLRLATIKFVGDLGQGNYFLAYRLFHALLVFVFVMLFVRALQVRDWRSLLVVPFALTVFLGIHTFFGTVKEEYPIPHFLEIAVLALAALNLCQSKGGWLIDLAMLLTFAVAALTLESGLLVWVVVVAAWLSGMQGASKRTVVACTALLAAYAWMRFGQNSVGVPTIGERNTGYLFETIDASQIRALFGTNLFPFYTYNVLSSMLSVLFSEPRSGVFVVVRALRSGDVAARNLVNVGASLLATGLIVAFVIDRWRSGIRRPVTLADRHVCIFAAVLLANAAMCYVYTKDEIMSVAGAFYAVAVFGAAAHFLPRWLDQPRTLVATSALCVMLLAGSAVWAIRAAGVHEVLRAQAFAQRNDWTRLERDWGSNGNWERYSASMPLIRELRDQAIATQVVNPQFVPRWMDRVFDIY